MNIEIFHNPADYDLNSDAPTGEHPFESGYYFWTYTNDMPVPIGPFDNRIEALETAEVEAGMADLMVA